jgi:hypothetical protein
LDAKDSLNAGNQQLWRIKSCNFLSPEAQVAIKIHCKKYQWSDPLPNKTVDDGRSILHLVLKLMHPDVQTNAYAELAKTKNIKPVDFGFNIMKWHSAMESKHM